MNLNEFLITAKSNTYAAQNGRVDSSRLNSVDFEFKKDGYYYLDSYFGERDFSGEEIVYYNDLPVWSMNYYGKLLRDGLPEGFIETLKEALKKVPAEKPYRGPDEYNRGDYCYTCSVDGDIDFFNGVEKIFLAAEEVYRLYFHGGCIRK